MLEKALFHLTYVKQEKYTNIKLVDMVKNSRYDEDSYQEWEMYNGQAKALGTSVG
ncbi:hypothetical protein ADA01nite_32590 [Aneurinibacillus danicus]|uniref:Uncharacterized protein n=1 Tax=Aneurinibacillus danicus TaxID=267746 RepID=A0A511VAB3_9BACL|nr:hypothetical protein ADA01nite_32590 [Aneurinibacillus danicus]